MERVEFAMVRAPETSGTATLSGTDLMVEPARRVRPGASIDARAFNLQNVGHVPGCEREYMEENQAFGPEDDSSSDCDTVCSVEDAGAGSLDPEDVGEDDDPDLCDPTLAAGAPSDEDDEDEEAAAAAAGANEEKVMENLAAEIGKAVHISMLKSIRNTAVLSHHSKKTMLNVNRFRNSFLNLECAAEDEQDEDLRELLNFQI